MTDGKVPNSLQHQLDLFLRVLAVPSVSGFVAKVKPSRHTFLVELRVNGGSGQFGVQRVRLLWRSPCLRCCDADFLANPIGWFWSTPPSVYANVLLFGGSSGQSSRVGSSKSWRCRKMPFGRNAKGNAPDATAASRSVPHSCTPPRPATPLPSRSDQRRSRLLAVCFWANHAAVRRLAFSSWAVVIRCPMSFNRSFSFPHPLAAMLAHV